MEGMGKLPSLDCLDYVLDKLKKQYNSGKDISMQDFCSVLASSTVEWKKFEWKTIILEEVFRIVFDLELPLKEGLDHPLSMKNIEGAEKLFQKSKKYLKGKSRRNIYLLDLVWMGENPAIVSFQDQEYTCKVLDEPTRLYRAGNSGSNRALGKYWTREKAPSISFIRQSCAVKDDWDVNPVTLDDFFVPYVDCVYTFEVTEKLVAFEGKAAPLHDFMKVDELAKNIFRGGEDQLLIVNPSYLGSRLIRIGDKEPLKGCSPWELLGIHPSELAKHAFNGYFENHSRQTAKLSLVDHKDEHGLTPLHYACLSVDGRVETIKYLLGCHADPCIESGPSSGCLTPLIIAAMVGNVTNIETLLAVSKRTGEEMLKAERQNRRSPLHFAAKFGRGAALELMFSKVPDYLRPPAPDTIDNTGGPDPVDKAGCTPLWVACRHGKKSAAEVLIKYKANINHELLLQNETRALAENDLRKKAADWDEDKHLFLVGATPLHTAVLGGHLGIVEMLIDKKCAAPLEGLDLLHQAVCTGNKEVVEILAKRGEEIGMNVNAGLSKSGIGNTALHLAVVRGNLECVEALLCPGTSVEPLTKNERGWNALHFAVQFGAARLEILDAILGFRPDDGALVNAKLEAPDTSGTTPLILAAALGPEKDRNASVVKALLHRKADPLLKDNNGYSAVARSAHAGHVAAIKKLCEAVKAAEKSPHDPDNHGWTPLHRAASAGHLDAVKELLKPEFGPIPAFGKKARAGYSAAENEHAKGHALEGKVVTPWHVARNEEIKKLLKKALRLADDGAYPGEARARQQPFAFSRAVPDSVFVSADGLTVSRVGTQGWLGAVAEPAVSSAERCYAEWVIEAADVCCCIMIGVTDLDAAPPAGQSMYMMPTSRMYSCRDSRAFPGSRDWGPAGQRARGERVGLLVERGSVWVCVNGARLGPGPMATDLPQRVRFAIEMFYPKTTLKLVPGAAPPRV